MVSSTQITAVVPTGSAGAVPVTVVTPGGTTSGDVSYYYLAAPVLTDRAPASGPTAGGNTVVLTGTGLVAASAVRFGAAMAGFTVVSDVQINAVAPPGRRERSPSPSSPRGVRATAWRTPIWWPPC